MTTTSELSDTATQAVGEALEQTKVVSHLHPPGSFNLEDHPIPGGLEEVWRFTPIKRLNGLHNGTFTPGGKITASIDADPVVEITMVDRDDPRPGSIYMPNDRVSAQAWNGFDKATVISVPPNVEVDEPVQLTLRGDGTDGASFAHTFIEVGNFAKATIVLDHVGSAIVAANVEVLLGDGAQLKLVSIQDWDDDAVHLAHHHARVGRDASYQHVAVTLGGDLVRINASVDYAGPGGNVEMYGVYFADKGQHLEHRLFVDHNTPKTRSNVEYKGALQGQDAHTVWIGDVLIRKAAVGIETFEANDNLILSDGARADSVPNLEIETGEIAGAGHSSTTGRFNDEHLFYLMSRGIEEQVARNLVVHGFFNAIIRRIGVDQIEERLMSAVEGELAKSVEAAS